MIVCICDNTYMCKYRLHVDLYRCILYTNICILYVCVQIYVQGGEDPQDALSLQVIFYKRDL